MRIAAVVLVCLGILSGCASASPKASEQPDTARGEGEDADADAGPTADDGESLGDASVATELPPELVAELRQQGADADGRLLTLAPGFIATAACSDCGAPSYLWFVAVRCSDTRHCEVLTEVCEGQISREADVYSLEFRAVEGAEADVCAGYSGTFEGMD